ncbi:hypothetical protein O6H91_18G038500 [Diphasiastrum complanatum]|uniref:Uncharacterized protein n=1 Tax=Diphasiastrum complanatum TaxID=34168 RepID=A0ACC2B026_DIPCM|nr:hypothetical protein O6H91_18G038500 [Diphasiastrum complanatum]
MDLGVHETDLGMPIPSSYGGMHEAAKLKVLTTASGNGTPPEELRALEAIKAATAKKAVRYRECLKNHAASIGGHAIDGCGEFMPSGEEGTMEALKCAACDCHRNFHRREVDGEPPFSCADCLQARNKDRIKRSGGSGQLSPPHVHLALPSSAVNLCRPSVPMLMALNNRALDAEDQEAGQGYALSASPMKKRFRTKFSVDQKEKMCIFAEKLGWRIQKHDEVAVQQFCADVGVKRHVLKVWMHNNKHTFGKKPLPSLSPPHLA